MTDKALMTILEELIEGEMSDRESDEATVERVARAICRAWFYCALDKPDGAEHWRKNENRCKAEARAALAAIGSGTQGRDAVIEECVKFCLHQENDSPGLENFDEESGWMRACRDLAAGLRALASPEKVTAPTQAVFWDDPELDATDGAHPAWWRGDDHGVKGTVNRLTEALDGKDNGKGVIGYEPLEALRRRLIALTTPPAAIDPLSDLVARFSAALLDKLRAAEEKHGWENDWLEPREKDFQQALLKHLAKGDPRDVAAYCAFLWHHGWPTVATTPAASDLRERRPDGSLYVTIPNLPGFHFIMGPGEGPDSLLDALDQFAKLYIAAIRAEAKAEGEREIRDALSLRLNNHLVDMKEGYDASIVGFNEAWNIISKYFDWLAANQPSPTGRED